MSVEPYESNEQDENSSQVTRYFDTSSHNELLDHKLFTEKRELKALLSDLVEMTTFVREFSSLSANQQSQVLIWAKGQISEYENKNGSIAFGMIGAGTTLLIVKNLEIQAYIALLTGIVFVVAGAWIAKLSPNENKKVHRLEALIEELERTRDLPKPEK